MAGSGAPGQVRREGRPSVVGHRGAMGYRPENTLASFEHAAELGADWIELDVHLSREGVPVVIHDPTLERTAGGRGPVSRRTVAQLKKLDAGRWWGEAWTGQQILTLEEALLWARGVEPIRLMVEIKSGPVLYPGIEAAVVLALERSAMLERAMVISFDHASVRRVKTLDPRVMTGVLYVGRPVDEVSLAVGAGADVLLPHWAFVTPEGVLAAHQAGLAVAAWASSDRAVLRGLLAAGVDAITTDHPDVLRRLVKGGRRRRGSPARGAHER